MEKLKRISKPTWAGLALGLVGWLCLFAFGRSNWQVVGTANILPMLGIFMVHATGTVFDRKPNRKPRWWNTETVARVPWACIIALIGAMTAYSAITWARR